MCTIETLEEEKITLSRIVWSRADVDSILSLLIHLRAQRYLEDQWDKTRQLHGSNTNDGDQDQLKKWPYLCLHLIKGMV